jgi:MFS family permease
LFGYRLIFRIGLLLSAVGCAACAAAPSWPLFLWARSGQGIGTALALSCAPALATSVYPAEQRLKALAGFSMAMLLSAAIGPLLGGVVVELWGWPAVYWMRVPIALVTLALSGLLPAPQLPPRAFDAPGAVLLASCMSTLLLRSCCRNAPPCRAGRRPPLLAVALVLLALYVRPSAARARADHPARPVRGSGIRRCRTS